MKASISSAENVMQTPRIPQDGSALPVKSKALVTFGLLLSTLSKINFLLLLPALLKSDRLNIVHDMLLLTFVFNVLLLVIGIQSVYVGGDIRDKGQTMANIVSIGLAAVFTQTSVIIIGFCLALKNNDLMCIAAFIISAISGLLVVAIIFITRKMYIKNRRRTEKSKTSETENENSAISDKETTELTTVRDIIKNISHA